MRIRSENYRNMFILHFTVLIWGFTGILGELISISALPLVWYRVLIASVAILIYFLIGKQSFYISSGRQMLKFLGIGLIVGAHWGLFFHSIKVSTVSVTLVTLSAVTLFTSILEPLLNRKSISKVDVFIGVVIIFGIYLIFTFEFQYLWGIIYGLLAALCASIFSIFNAKWAKSYRPTVITFYEMIGAFLGISLVLFTRGDLIGELSLSWRDGALLLVLGIVCTAVAYVLAVAVMKQLSAFTVALATNLEPVYGILLAVLFFGHKETMSMGFYLGASIVLTAVFLYPYLKKTLVRRSKVLVS